MVRLMTNKNRESHVNTSSKTEPELGTDVPVPVTKRDATNRRQDCFLKPLLTL